MKTINIRKSCFVLLSTGFMLLFNISTAQQNGSLNDVQYAEAAPLKEKVTILRNNNNGTHTYFNEAAIDENGNPIEARGIVIDVPSDVIDQFEQIIRDGEVLNQLVQNLSQTAVGGNVSYNGNTNEFTYVDGNGNKQTINISETVKSNETVTTFTNNDDGTYTHISENNTETILNITRTGTSDPNSNETIGKEGSIYVNKTTGDMYTYNPDPNGDGNTTDGTWKSTNTNTINTTLGLNTAKDSLIVTDSDGNKVRMLLSDLAGTSADTNTTNTTLGLINKSIN